MPIEARLWLWRVDSAQDASTTMHGWGEARLVVRALRGQKMRSLDDLWDEFAAALQFPYYFGENWAAFDECIKDLGWLPSEAGYAIVVGQPQLVLDQSAADFSVLVRVLTEAVAEWAAPVALGEWWDRPPVPFNVILAAGVSELDDVQARWGAAGGGARLDQLS